MVLGRLVLVGGNGANVSGQKLPALLAAAQALAAGRLDGLVARHVNGAVTADFMACRWRCFGKR